MHTLNILVYDISTWERVLTGGCRPASSLFLSRPPVMYVPCVEVGESSAGGLAHPVLWALRPESLSSSLRLFDLDSKVALRSLSTLSRCDCEMC